MYAGCGRKAVRAGFAAEERFRPPPLRRVAGAAPHSVVRSGKGTSTCVPTHDTHMPFGWQAAQLPGQALPCASTHAPLASTACVG